MSEKVISEMKRCALQLYVRCFNEFGGVLQCELDFGYDKPNTSYVCNFNIAGCELDVVYVFDENTIYVYDTVHDINRIEYTNANTNLEGIELVFDFVKQYSQLYHYVESVIECELL